MAQLINYMVNPQLLNYIKQCLEQNFNKEQIMAELVKTGWPENDIYEAFGSVPPTGLIIKSAALEKKPEAKKNEADQPVYKKKTWHLPSIKFNKTTTIIITTLAFLFLGTGALAYYHYFPSPERVISKMLDRLSSINSLAYASELKIEYQLDKSLIESSFYKDFSGMINPSTLEWLAVPGVFDKPHQVSLILNGQSDFQADVKNTITFKIQTDELFNNTVLGAEVRSLDQLVYTNLDLPNLGFVDLSVLLNQWIKYDATSNLEKLNNLKNLENTSSSTGTSSEKIVSFFEKVTQAKDLLIGASVFQITTVLANEKINNIDTRHYEFTINQENLGQFIKEIDNKFTAEGKRLTEQEIIKIRESLNKLELIKGEIWIGKKDFLPYKLFIDLAVKDESLSISKTGTDPIKVKKISLTLSSQNFNQPINIQIPESTKSFEEVMILVLSQIVTVEENPTASDVYPTNTGLEEDQFLLDDQATSTDYVNSSDFPVEVKDEKIADSDNDGLSDYEEKDVYKTNYLLPDTDGDGYLDGAEVNNGYNPNGEGFLLLDSQ